MDHHATNPNHHMTNHMTNHVINPMNDHMNYNHTNDRNHMDHVTYSPVMDDDHVMMGGHVIDDDQQSLFVSGQLGEQPHHMDR